MLHPWLFNGASPDDQPDVTRSGQGVWEDVCEEAFRTLKTALVSAPVLAYPIGEGHFTLSTYASDVGIGAVLEQDQDEGG